jgi:mannose-6-phosphate isomerase-like protein (cupin superfamily)
MISKLTAEHYAWNDRCDGWHLVRTGQLSVIHERMQPGSAETRHLHRVARQFFFVLEGVLTVELPHAHEVLRAHEAVEVPPGTPHNVVNRSCLPVEFLVISEPPSHDDRLAQ